MTSYNTHDSHGTAHGTTHDIVDDDDEVMTIGILHELEKVIEVIFGDILAGGGIPTAAPGGSVVGNNGAAGGGSTGGGSRLSTVIDVHRILSDAEIELCTHTPGI